MPLSWKLKGDFVLSCNCDVFCPCVLSLGKSQPTHGVCHTWWGIRIEEGHATTGFPLPGAVKRTEKLDGLNVGMLLETPGPLAEGNWTVGLYLDEKANAAATEALVQIFTGKAGGPTGWFSIMISEFLGTKQVPISIEKNGNGWKVQIPKIIDGAIEPIAGANGKGATQVTNSGYWVAPDVVVGRGTRSRFRDWGRNWDLSGKSAEYCRIDWAGP